jgi:hypothetical protein
VRRARTRKEGGRTKKLTEHAEWRFGEKGEIARAVAKTEALLRRKAESEGRPYVPRFDSSTFEPPALSPANADAWELFLSCQSQVITAGLGSVIGIDESTLKWKMDLLEIPADEQLDTLEKFQLIAEIFVASCARASSSSSSTTSTSGNPNTGAS